VERGTARAASSLARAARDDGGFTILESLTAATILLVVSVGIVMVLVTTGGWYAKATVRTQANTVASQVMSIILSRNYGDLHYPTQADVDARKMWPAVIPQRMVWPTTIGDYSVETNLTPTTDPATGVDMQRITVIVNPVSQTLDPPATVIRYASGWQGMASTTGIFKVPVHVQLKQGGVNLAARGVRVQLLDPLTMAEARYAITDGTGLAVFTDVVERPDGYFLTADPRFGTDVRPLHFPTRHFPTHGGSANSPILSINSYDLEVHVANQSAILRVGVFRGSGWRFAGQGAGGTMNWVSTEIPYRPVYSEIVYAKPTLNTSTDNSIYGIGNLPRYPDETNMVYSGTVNAYGVACIEVPWTTDVDEGQYWTIWCSTTDADGIVDHHARIDYATGSWTADIKMPDLPSTGVYTEAPQWEHLGDAAQPHNDPTPQRP
jgi:type II secretory pathway pseudopilin PulG